MNEYEPQRSHGSLLPPFFCPHEQKREYTYPSYYVRQAYPGKYVVVGDLDRHPKKREWNHADYKQGPNTPYSFFYSLWWLVVHLPVLSSHGLALVYNNVEQSDRSNHPGHVDSARMRGTRYYKVPRNLHDC